MKLQKIISELKSEISVLKVRRKSEDKPRPATKDENKEKKITPISAAKSENTSRLTTSNPDKKIKCRYSDTVDGCQRSRCKFFHPPEEAHCEKWLKGGACLTRFCLLRHSAGEKERRREHYSHNSRKRTRSEWSPNRNTKRIHSDLLTRTQGLSIREKVPLVCREWDRRGRCSSAPSSAQRCEDGNHFRVSGKEDLRKRADLRAGLRVVPRRNGQSSR